ncbi:MAG TPA: fluoride efflux transporter CrcB [Mycobacteriales bacterium]|nr:fluoride efflux transporter CrcB [Mycobacteriales bacterium]
MALACLVALAAAAGSVARYAIDIAIQRNHHRTGLPWGTFVINMTGSFVLGLVTGLAAHHGLGADPTAILGIGLCGGYTTWSALTWETWSLAEQGRLGAATANVLGSLAVGVAAGAAGLGLALL